MEQENNKKQSAFMETVGSASFLEKMIILLFTFLGSGLLIPFISNDIQRTKAKNDVIMQSQNKLLEDVAKTIHSYESLATDISYYKSMEALNGKLSEKAFERYSDRIPDLLADLRLEIIKTKILASDSTSAMLSDFQDKILVTQDSCMNKLYVENASTGAWDTMHAKNLDMLSQADVLIFRLAKDMNLTRSNLK